ncbi:MAG TPA: baseplate J/gp47 family protein [Clostridia bacterium]|nr:baseplate J/gp47 family protein [Clostridia bacterium]
MSDIKFVEVDALAIQNDMISQFEVALGETLYPGDERRIFLLQHTPVIVGLKNDINETGKQNLLRYARGENLDALGYNTPRLKAQNAIVTLKWTLSAAQIAPVTIAAGKRGSPDGVLFFANKVDCVVPAGQIEGTVIAEAVKTGPQYNGFVPGQINKIIDSTPYVISVTNIDESAGGADIEPDDDGVNVWSGYRERIRLSSDSYSTAGPEGGYIYWAKTADINIADVGILSPAPLEIVVVVLMKDGELPAQSVLDTVLAAVTPKNRRPMSDLVTAAAATVDTYNINLTYYISAERNAEEAVIRSLIEDDGGSIDQYIAWQHAKLKRAVNPDTLKNLMLVAGAFRVDITSPVYTAVAEGHVAKAGTINVVYGGLI